MPDIEGATKALTEARSAGKAIPPIGTRFGLTTSEDAYRVQERITARDLAAGRRLAGRKIGLTSKAVQAQLGVDEPDFGMIWADTEFAPEDEVPAGMFVQPRVEAEVAFLLGRDINGEDIRPSSIVSAVDCAFAAVEIVDSAIADWKITLVDTIADNASAGGYVLGGAPRRLSEIDLRLCGMTMTRSGSDVSIGLGAACMGNPLNALTWLARKMADVGRPLKTGDIVLSGALGPMVSADRGSRYHVTIAGFPPFSIGFAK